MLNAEKSKSEVTDDIVNVGDFLNLVKDSEYKCYYGWFEEYLKDSFGLNEKDNLPLARLLMVVEGVLAYEERDTVNNFSLFVIENTKGIIGGCI